MLRKKISLDKFEVENYLTQLARGKSWTLIAYLKNGFPYLVNYKVLYQTIPSTPVLKRRFRRILLNHKQQLCIDILWYLCFIVAISTQWINQQLFSSVFLSRKVLALILIEGSYSTKLFLGWHQQKQIRETNVCLVFQLLFII